MLSLMTATALLASTAVALPAGGPQGPSTFTEGQTLYFAVINPSGLDYVSSNYSISTPSRVFVNMQSTVEAAPRVQLTAEVSGQDITPVRMAEEALWLMFGPDGGFTAALEGDGDYADLYVENYQLQSYTATDGFMGKFQEKRDGGIGCNANAVMFRMHGSHAA